MSTNTGVKPFCSTAAMSETQVSGRHDDLAAAGRSLSAASVTRLADEPELTKTLCFTPSQSDHSLLEGADVARLREDRVVLPQEAQTASRSSRVMLFFISGQSRPACRVEVGAHQNGPLNSTPCRSGLVLGNPAGFGPFHQVAGGGGDRPGVGIEQVLQARGGRAGDGGEARAAEAEGRARPSAARATRGDDLGAGAAGRPAVVHHEQPPGLLRRRGDRVHVERAEPDRVDDLGGDADRLQMPAGGAGTRPACARCRRASRRRRRP